MKIAVLGMGAMGARMAARLVATDGFEVTVWNRSAGRTADLEAAGATVAATPAEAVAGADVALTMLRDDDASRHVWLGDGGALAALPDGAVALECSTITPAWARELAAAADALGVRLLDAPLSGSTPQAEAGALIFFVGGDADALATAQPVLDVVGGGTHHLGPSGAGAQLKLATNALLATQVAAVGEIVAMLQGSGLDAAQAVEVLASTPVMSTAAAGAARNVAVGKFPLAFALELAVKDLEYARSDAAARRPEGLPLLDAVTERYRAAVDAGLAEENFTAVAKLYDADA